MGSILAHHDWMFDGNWTWVWPIAVAVQVAFWAFVVWLVVRVVRPWVRARPPKGPERILSERFADGSISADEYRARLEVLRGSGERS